MEEAKRESSPEKIAELIRENEKLRQENVLLKERLTYDGITGLFRTQDEGRKKILAEIETLQKKNKKVGLIRIDINDLKSWNHEFGHDPTDEVILADLGRRLTQWAEEKGGMAMRFHFKGDELGVLLPADNAEEIGQFVSELDNFPINSPKGEIVCSFTTGLAHQDEDEVRKEIEKLDEKENGFSEEGRLFTALRRVADKRERAEERRKKGKHG
jgi:diguanylate cyclase (GGDEF)-like protein